MPSTVYALEGELSEAKTAYIDINYFVDFHLNIDSDAQLEELEVESYFIPNEDDPTQNLFEFNINPQNYELNQINTNFYTTSTYTDIDELSESNQIEKEFEISNDFKHSKVEEMVSFSQVLNENNNNKYLEFNDMLDSNEELVEKANELSQGEEDVFKIASTIAKWVRDEVEYDLSTLDEEAKQTSTQTLERKEGVCREITNLYVSMMRSIGIPTRIVTGFAYTENDEVVDRVGSNWGGHAWAEVKIGNQWVPFDLTYDKYGYTGAEHISLAKSPFPDEMMGAEINLYGHGIDFPQNAIEQDYQFSVEDIETLPSNHRNIDLELDGPESVHPDGKNYIKATLKNNDDYYKNVLLSGIRIENVEYKEREKLITLKPQEEKEVYFKYEFESLEEEGTYTFPFSIYSRYLQEDFSVEVSTQNDKLEEFPQNDQEETPQEAQKYPPTLDCSISPSEENNLIKCNTTNPNNQEAQDVQVCIEENDCKTFNLNMGETKNLEFKTEEFFKELYLEWEDKSQETSVSLEKPSLNIEENKDEDKVNMKIEIDNFNDYTYTSLIINSEEEIFNEDKLSQNISLSEGENEIKINLNYNDKELESKSFNYEFIDDTLDENEIEEESTSEEISEIEENQSSEETTEDVSESKEEKDSQNDKNWIQRFVVYLQELIFG